MNLIRIENVNHRLENGTYYYYHPALKHMGTEHPVLFTAAEMQAATIRAEKAAANPLLCSSEKWVFETGEDFGCICHESNRRETGKE